MGVATEVGFVFQCALCGSFSVFAVDALDPAEVLRRATGAAFAAGHTQKTLQREVHAGEQELLEEIQRRLAPGPHSTDGSRSAVRWGVLPCSACTEITVGQKYVEWLEDRRNLDEAPVCTPQVPVVFEDGEEPPAYLLKSGRWCLGQGVGPKDLDVRLPNHLPAGQFRMLLPQAAPPLRPPCWAAEADEGPEVWSSRQALIEAVAELAASVAPDGHAPGRGAEARAPPIGSQAPWLEELLEEAAASYAQQAPAGRRRGPAPPPPGAARRYVPVPLLRATEVLRPLAEAQLLALQ